MYYRGANDITGLNLLVEQGLNMESGSKKAAHILGSERRLVHIMCISLLHLISLAY